MFFFSMYMYVLHVLIKIRIFAKYNPVLETYCLWPGITRSISYSGSSNRLIVYCLSFRSRIIQSLRDVTIVGVGLQNLCDCSAFEKGWVLIIPYMLYDTEPGLHDFTRKTRPFSRLFFQTKGNKDPVWPASPRDTKLRNLKWKTDVNSGIVHRSINSPYGTCATILISPFPIRTWTSII